MAATKTTFRVAEGVQVHHDGVTYGPGETFAAAGDSDDVVVWLNAGWITPATPKRSR